MLFREAEGDVVGNDKRESSRHPAQPETPGMPGNSRRENRETPRVSGSQRPDRLEKATSYKEGQRVRHRGGYFWFRPPARAVALPRGVGRTGSTCEVSQPGCVRPAEGMEGSRSTQGNTEENRTLRAQDRKGVSQGLQRVREAARRDQKQKFTALLHPVTTGLLPDSYYWLKREAAPGVDGMTWAQ